MGRCFPEEPWKCHIPGSRSIWRNTNSLENLLLGKARRSGCWCIGHWWVQTTCLDQDALRSKYRNRPHPLVCPIWNTNAAKGYRKKDDGNYSPNSQRGGWHIAQIRGSDQHEGAPFLMSARGRMHRSRPPPRISHPGRRWIPLYCICSWWFHINHLPLIG